MKVYLFDRLAGFLTGTPDLGVTFTYDKGYLANGGPALSLSLPLRNESFSSKECLPYFEGLLPDGELRKNIADFLHVSDRSTLKLLDALGKECAGTVAVIGDDENLKASAADYRALSDDEIIDHIRKMPMRPLMHSEDGIRLSLAGAQDKIALAKIKRRWHTPLNGAPSTHIFKPSRDIDNYRSIAENEYICTSLAKECGLKVPACEMDLFGDYPVFIIERYDRKTAGKKIRRLHQEDFCQALGIHPDHKYESDGGPSILQMVKLLQQYSTEPIVDIQLFVRSIIFNFLIGNCDAHGKNYSLLENDGAIRLAPLYDLVCTRAYPELTLKFSMKIGGKYDIRKIAWKDFLETGKACGISPKMLTKIRDELFKALPMRLKAFEDESRYADTAKKIKAVMEQQISRIAASSRDKQSHKSVATASRGS